jgi:hypothetical protein
MTQIKTDAGLMLSLEYLSKEASTVGDYGLHALLKTIIEALRKREAGVSIKNQDAESVLNFLSLYQSTSPSVRKKVLSMINTFDLANLRS